MKQLYALLVGIDKYMGARPLAGCVADILDYEEFLRERVDRKTHELQLLKLIDGQATRAAVIEGFERHLAQAGPGDTALFVFCGHGSQQPSDPKHWKIEPDRMDETLVCYDSRIGGSDLADKEIARLLAKLSAKAGHVAVVLDACHSASGTRDATAEGRYAPPRLDPGPAGYPVETAAASRGVNESTLAVDHRHVLLAACRSNEIAKEIRVGTQKRGAFSASLLEALKTCPGRIAYRSLYESTAAAVRTRALGQNPQLESYDSADLDLPFLGGAVVVRPRQLSVDRDADRGWMLNLGAIHGVTMSGDPMRLLLYPRGTPPNEMTSPQGAVGRAVVSQVLTVASKVNLDFTPNSSVAGFEALVEWIPVPFSTVALSGDTDGLNQIRSQLATAGPDRRPSPFIKEGVAAPIHLDASVESFEICWEGQNVPLTTIERTWSGAAAIAVERLEHIACWQQISEGVKNEHGSIKAEEFAVLLRQDGKLLQGENLRLEYYEEAGEWHAPGFTIQLENRSQRRLYFSLLALTESFEICPLLDEPSVLVEPGQSTYARRGETMYASLPEWLRRRGGTETADTLKILVCTAQFDGRLLRQPALQNSASRSTGSRAPFAPTNLNLFLNRMQTRDVGSKPGSSIDDWLAVNVRIETVHPHPWLAAGPSEVLLAAAARVTCPAGFSTLARLNSETAALRAHLPPSVFDNNFGNNGRSNAAFRFLERCGNDPGLGVLELNSFSGREFVTPESPILISVDLSLKPEEHILPFTFDGRFHIPLGRSKTQNGTTSILLERLPSRASEEAHPVIRILFQRLTTQPAPHENAFTPALLEWAALVQALCLNGLIRRDWNPQDLAHLNAAEFSGPRSSTEYLPPGSKGAELASPLPEELVLIDELLGRMGIETDRQEIIAALIQTAQRFRISSVQQTSSRDVQAKAAER